MLPTSEAEHGVDWTSAAAFHRKAFLSEHHMNTFPQLLEVGCQTWQSLSIAGMENKGDYQSYTMWNEPMQAMGITNGYRDLKRRQKNHVPLGMDFMRTKIDLLADQCAQRKHGIATTRC